MAQEEQTKEMDFDFGALGQPSSEESGQASSVEQQDDNFADKNEELKKELEDFDPSALVESNEQEDDDNSEEGQEEQESNEQDSEGKDQQGDNQEQEDDEGQQETDSDTSSEEASSSSSSSELYAPVIAKALHSEGVLSEFDEEQFSKDVEEQGEGKALLNALSQQVEKEADRRAEQAKSEYEVNLTDDQKRFQDMLREGIPYEEAKDLMTNHKRYEGVKDEDIEEDTELAKSIIKDNYKKTTKFSEAKIDKIINKLDEEELVEEATSSKKSLIDLGKQEEKQRYESQVEERKKAEERSKQIAKDMKDYVYSMKDVNGIKLDDTMQDKVYKSLTTAVDNINGQPVNDIMKKQYNNPVKFNSLQTLYNELGLFNFDSNGNPSPDFSKLKKYLKTDGASMLEQELKGSDKKENKGKSKKQKPKNTPQNDQASFLEALKKGQNKNIF